MSYLIIKVLCRQVHFGVKELRISKRADGVAASEQLIKYFSLVMSIHCNV